MITKFTCESCKETKTEVKMLPDEAPKNICADCFNKMKLNEFPERKKKTMRRLHFVTD